MEEDEAREEFGNLTLKARYVSQHRKRVSCKNSARYKNNSCDIAKSCIQSTKMRNRAHIQNKNKTGMIKARWMI